MTGTDTNIHSVPAFISQARLTRGNVVCTDAERNEGRYDGINDRVFTQPGSTVDRWKCPETVKIQLSLADIFSGTELEKYD